MAEHYYQEARSCWIWLDRDKQSSSWLATISGLTGPAFSEAAATLLCLPSPACSARIRETVRGQKKIDAFGDNVRAAKLAGDRFRRRHDACKDFTLKLLRSSGVIADCKVFNLFARIDRGRTRQAMLPDFKISIPEAGGRIVPSLR